LKASEVVLALAMTGYYMPISEYVKWSRFFKHWRRHPFPNRALIQMPGKLFVSAKQRDGHR
jgi:hypothetical protein